MNIAKMRRHLAGAAERRKQEEAELEAEWARVMDEAATASQIRWLPSGRERGREHQAGRGSRLRRMHKQAMFRRFRPYRLPEWPQMTLTPFGDKLPRVTAASDPIAVTTPVQP